MPNNAFEVTIHQMEQALALARRDDAQSPFLVPLRSRLAEKVVELRALKIQQQRAQAEQRRLTREKNRVLQEGRDAASRLRHALQAVLDPRDETLAAFGIKPRGRHRRQG